MFLILSVVFPVESEHVEDLLAVRPGLHLPCGDRAAHTHRRPEPLRTLLRIDPLEPFAHPRVVLAPDVEGGAVALALEPLVGQLA